MCDSIHTHTHTHTLLQHLIESLWYAVLETFILLAAFHQELNFSFVTIVMTLFVVKSFHWLANDRVDFVSTSQSVPITLNIIGPTTTS